MSTLVLANAIARPSRMHPQHRPQSCWLDQLLRSCIRRLRARADASCRQDILLEHPRSAGDPDGANRLSTQGRDIMRMANRGGAVLAVLALVLAPAGAVRAQLSAEPVAGFAGVTTVDAVPSRPAPTPSLVNMTVYDNTSSPANFGFASTDLAATWGDQLYTIGTGLLSAQQFSVFNSGPSAGPLLTATIGVQLYEAATSVLLGSYSVSVNFGTGLSPGFYSLVNVTNLDPLGIIVNTTDVIVTQTVVSKSGAADRLGIASLNPPTVGSSPASMYIAASTVGGGAPGFYNIPTGPANPGYRVTVALPPVGTLSRSWGELKKLYR